MGLQTMNAPPIGAITIWSGAYNSSFLVNFLQANNMPKPNLQDGHKTNASFVLQKGPHPRYLFTFSKTFIWSVKSFDVGRDMENAFFCQVFNCSGLVYHYKFLTPPADPNYLVKK